MESLLSHDPNRDTPACFPCPDAPLSPPQSPVVLVAPPPPPPAPPPGPPPPHPPPHPPAPARRDRPAARAPGRARPAGQRVRQGRGIKVFGVIYARRAATSPSTAAPAIRVHLMRPPARRQACAALPRDVYTARYIRRGNAFKAEQRRYNHSAQPAILRRRNPAPCCNTPKFSTETVLQHGAAAAAA